ncbi:OmpA family protein [Arundinibacter roseus]|uniref:OmpA family protein n=1 Tax=Arundinibacter roseus TaxID=2070510 RepID=A0A4R4KLJ0_9BACT|nr:OmpA family protein [Arundinibacter roseus]TDB69138.1 OmpA family protein [Arundinibacter roseus]
MLMMIRSYILILILLTASLVAQAQGRISVQSTDSLVVKSLTRRVLTPYSVTVRGGLTQFFGELNTQDMQFMGGISLTQHVNPAFSMSLDFSAGKIGGEKIEFFNSYFINEYNSIELLARWDLTEQFSRYDDNKLHVGLYGGLGMMYFTADAYDLTTGQLVRFTNSDVSGRTPLFLRWGNPRGRIGVKKTRERTIPLGLTFNYHISPSWQVGLDYRFYFARNDKLDATSGRRLISPEEAQSYSDTPNDMFSFLSVALTHRISVKPRDTDKDGIPDDRDRCPDVPGSARFFGCPDSDGDGIPDYVDRCPDVAGPAGTRGCPDRDGDGVVDRLDDCPDVAGTLNGCPDRDGDGVRDDYDACPDVKGLVRFGGCPDTDGDNIPDPSDLCPDKPGTYENGGCPDTDGDGLHDGIDQCPTEAGPASRNGCPVPVVSASQRVQQKIDSLLQVPVRFATGTAIIDRQSFGILDQLVEVLNSYAQSRFVVEGHTDNTGNAAANQALSENRAQAVRRYLLEKGIEEDRMQAVGYGDTRPVADNVLPEGRARNRRVVIRLTN